MEGDGTPFGSRRALAVGAVALLVLVAGCGAALSGDDAGNGGANGNGGDDGKNGTQSTLTDVQATGERTPRTLVGVQSDARGWRSEGAVYQFEGTDVAWKHRDGAAYFEATRLENGSVVAAFLDGGYDDCGRFEAPCDHTGFRIIDPDALGGPAVEYEWGFPIRDGHNSEVHDVEALPGGGFVMSDMEYERILVWEDGEVTWQWNASEFYDAPADPTTTDWLHINDVDRIDDGRFLVSVRNANQLLVVERGEGVVEVINEDTSNADDDSCRRNDDQLRDTDGDGDIRCGDPSVLDHQHNPQWLADGVVLVADSDNDRVVELVRNDQGAWEPGWTLESAAGRSLHWPRDADRLPNGNTLVTDSRGHRVLVVNERGEVLWMVERDFIPYEADRLPHGEPVGGTVYSDRNES